MRGQASLCCCSSNGVAIPLCSFSPFASSPTRFPEFSLMVGSKHPPLLWSVAGQTSPGTATLGSCPQVLLNHRKNVRFGVCRHDVSSGGVVPRLALPSVSDPGFCPWSSFGQEHFWIKKKKKTLRWVDGSIPQPGAVPIYWRWSPQVLSPSSLHTTAKVIPTWSQEPHVSLVSGTLKWLSPVPHPHPI